MKTEGTTPTSVPVTPFERHLIHKHNLPDHWARTYNELLRGHR